jgi:DNA modification methylase
MILGREMNTLYYGDNLDVLRDRDRFPSDSVDLIYLDPPFQSGRNYNALFNEQDGTKSAAQIKAFEDTWDWDTGPGSAAEAYDEVVRSGGKVGQSLEAFKSLLGGTPMLAYLSMMAPRLVELRRVLKPTGSVYLHCDPTASAHLRLLMDAVFGPHNFRNEIQWQRTGAHGRAKRWGPIHDTLLFYTASDAYTWNRVFEKYDESYVENFYRFTDEHGRYRLVTLDVDPTKKGRHWELPPDRALPEFFVHPHGYSSMSVQQRLDVLDAAGLIYWPPRGVVPQYKRYLDVAEGNPVQDMITDIRPIASQAQERLGYPTQKPVALLERIIAASSNEGGVVLDPFCGIGIDITHLAVGLIKNRLLGVFGIKQKIDYQVIGEPEDLAGAKQLASEDRHQFEHWALGLVGARASAHGKGSDKGIDGVLMFQEGSVGGEHKRVIISVKSGHVDVGDVRDLRGVVEREKVVIGVLITLEDPTGPMKREAASAGFYDSPWGKHPRLQILTIEELLGNNGIDMPPIRPGGTTFKQAVRVETPAETLALPGMANPTTPPSPTGGKRRKRK